MIGLCPLANNPYCGNSISIFLSPTLSSYDLDFCSCHFPPGSRESVGEQDWSIGGGPFPLATGHEAQDTSIESIQNYLRKAELGVGGRTE